MCVCTCVLLFMRLQIRTNPPTSAKLCSSPFFFFVFVIVAESLALVFSYLSFFHYTSPFCFSDKQDILLFVCLFVCSFLICLCCCCCCNYRSFPIPLNTATPNTGNSRFHSLNLSHFIFESKQPPPPTYHPNAIL